MGCIRIVELFQASTDSRHKNPKAQGKKEEKKLSLQLYSMELLQYSHGLFFSGGGARGWGRQRWWRCRYLEPPKRWGNLWSKQGILTRFHSWAWLSSQLPKCAVILLELWKDYYRWYFLKCDHEYFWRERLSFESSFLLFGSNLMSFLIWWTYFLGCNLIWKCFHLWVWCQRFLWSKSNWTILLDRFWGFPNWPGDYETCA